MTLEDLKSAVTPEDAAHILFVTEGRGYEPGSFTKSLIEAILRADSYNTALLRLVYPGLVAGVDVYKNTFEGRDQLEAIFTGG